MTQLKTKYEDACRVSIVVAFGDETRQVDNVVLDSGFVHSTFGLMLPRREAPQNMAFGSAVFTLADGNQCSADTVVRGVITRVEGKWLDDPIPTPVAFMEKSRPLLGVRVLKRWVVELHGPSSKATIHLGE